MMTNSPTDYAANVRTALAAASPEDVARGRAWYPRAREIASAIADRNGLTVETVAYVMAALSPRNWWHSNVQDAAAICEYHVRGRVGPIPIVCTFGANRDRALEILAGTGEWRSKALKVRSFVSNILGDDDSVTVDVWAYRVATGGESPGRTVAGNTYRAIAAAYRAVAAETDYTPAEVQAITWSYAERVGIGSNRRGHRTGTKRGTYSYICALLAA